MIKMSMYPSLEDMKVDQVMQAQVQHVVSSAATAPPASSSPYPSLGATYPILEDTATPAAVYSSLDVVSSPSGPVAYPGLAEYMGMELTRDIIAANMPEYLPENQQRSLVLRSDGGGSLVAPLSSSSPGLYRAQVSHGVRQVVVCKDGAGKVGMRVKAVNKGIFVCLVIKDSPAAGAGLRFGDQILQVNGVNVAGYSSDKVHDLLKKASENNIVLAVRDRPFERTITLHKDSTGHVGFQFKEGRITSIAVDSSAARNGLLIDHNLLEVNGQNVVGIKDKEVSRIIDDGGQIVTLTIIPSFIYTHIMKSMSSFLVKKMMDHSVPDIM